MLDIVSLWLPSVNAFEPLHPPPAVQDVAPKTTQVRVEVTGEVPPVGFAEMLTSGGLVPGVTVTAVQGTPLLQLLVSFDSAIVPTNEALLSAQVRI